VANICATFPGITPMNIYDIPYRVWQSFAVNIDNEIEHRRAAAAEQAMHH